MTTTSEMEDQFFFYFLKKKFSAITLQESYIESRIANGFKNLIRSLQFVSPHLIYLPIPIQSIYTLTNSMHR